MTFWTDRQTDGQTDGRTDNFFVENSDKLGSDSSNDEARTSFTLSLGLLFGFDGRRTGLCQLSGSVNSSTLCTPPCNEGTMVRRSDLPPKHDATMPWECSWPVVLRRTAFHCCVIAICLFFRICVGSRAHIFSACRCPTAWIAKGCHVYVANRLLKSWLTWFYSYYDNKDYI